MIVSAAIIGIVISVVRNASRITENATIRTVTQLAIFRRDRMDKYESCDDCIYSDVEESVCVQMLCIHAVPRLRERYIPKESVKEADLQPMCLTGFHDILTPSARNAEDEERERSSSARGAGGGWCNDGHIIIHCRLRGRRSDHNCAGSIGGGRLRGAT